jgi:HAD superfamily phosphoserine phosphatase-like hydrolase
MTTAKYKNSAAFYDVDGTLIRINIVHAFAFYAAREPSLLRAARKWGITAASLPLFWAADKVSRKWFNELFYRLYEGMSEDRLVTLSEELFEDVIKPNIYPRARDLIEESRRAGCRQVIVSGALDFTLRPLVAYLGVDDLIANRLEFYEGCATGKLAKPFVGGATKAEIMRRYARARGVGRRIRGPALAGAAHRRRHAEVAGEPDIALGGSMTRLALGLERVARTSRGREPDHGSEQPRNGLHGRRIPAATQSRRSFAPLATAPRNGAGRPRLGPMAGHGRTR